MWQDWLSGAAFSRLRTVRTNTECRQPGPSRWEARDAARLLPGSVLGALLPLRLPLIACGRCLLVLTVSVSRGCGRWAAATPLPPLRSAARQLQAHESRYISVYHLHWFSRVKKV